MIVNDLDGNQVKWRPKNRPRGNASALHIRARLLLKEIYPTAPILEEVAIPVKRGKTLFLDFYIQILNLAIEIDGAQHFHYSNHFYKSKRHFAAAMNNDYMKAEFCEINNITLVRLKYGQPIDKWRDALL